WTGSCTIDFIKIAQAVIVGVRNKGVDVRIGTLAEFEFLKVGKSVAIEVAGSGTRSRAGGESVENGDVIGEAQLPFIQESVQIVILDQGKGEGAFDDGTAGSAGSADMDHEFGAIKLLLEVIGSDLQFIAADLEFGVVVGLFTVGNEFEGGVFVAEREGASGEIADRIACGEAGQEGRFVDIDFQNRRNGGDAVVVNQRTCLIGFKFEAELPIVVVEGEVVLGNDDSVD